MKPIRRLLIANRGEIAVRIIRCCRELGIESVAVYSEADAGAQHVVFADLALPLGGAAPSESYLNINKLIAAAKSARADAVHPGYGFLSENDDFAAACEKNGLLFVGPTAENIHAMGDKVRARDIAVRAGVPVVPGTPPLAAGSDPSPWLKSIGMPMLIKCSGGGGGHGMRFVERAEDLEMALRLTRSEGLKAFGDDTVYIERALRKPRHIEVQLFGFGDGRVAHLFTRGCSAQRRYQKIVEEAPAPAVEAATLRRIEQDAVRLASAIRYRGAGTAEFLLDAAGEHYFLEMNTRLQVEHAVTEMVLGIDLVAMQLRLAAGDLSLTPLLEKLLAGNAEVQPRGHAIECRIYAEDPLQNFAPSPGEIIHLRLPQGPGVRLDSAIYAGYRVPMHYDPMIAKLIVWGPDRETARRRLLVALRETVVSGIRTNLDFLRVLAQSPAFVRGDYATDVIQQEQLIDKLRQQHTQQAADMLPTAAATLWLQPGRQLQGEPLDAWRAGLMQQTRSET